MQYTLDSARKEHSVCIKTLRVKHEHKGAALKTC